MNRFKRVFTVLVSLALLVACLSSYAIVHAEDVNSDFNFNFSELLFVATVKEIDVSTVTYYVGEQYTLPVITATYNDDTSEVLPEDISVVYPAEWPTEAGTYTLSVLIATKFNVEFTVNVLSEEEEIMYGDATGDGVVNGTDVVRLMNYIANYDYDTGVSTVEVAAGADATGDGVVNGTDVVRLMNYIANYDYETGESTVVLGPQK